MGAARIAADFDSSQLGLRRIEDDYSPVLGFVRDVGVSSIGGEFGYWWRASSGDDVIARLGGCDQAGLEDAREHRQADAQVLLGNAIGDTIHTTVIVEHEVIMGDFQILPELLIPAGAYRGEFATLDVRLSTARPLSGLISMKAGDFYGGSRDDYALEITWQPSRVTALSVSATRTGLNLSSGVAQILEAALRLSLTPSTRV